VCASGSTVTGSVGSDDIEPSLSTAFDTIDQWRIRPETTRSSPLVVYVDASHYPGRQTTVAAIVSRHTRAYVGMRASVVDCECGTRAEFHAVNHALSMLARTDGADHVVVRTDADAVVSSFEMDNYDSWLCAYGVATHGLARNFDYCTLESVSRDDNVSADTACDVLRWADRDHYLDLDGNYLDELEDLEPYELDGYPPHL